ncbi:MAG: helix-turn-helix transcriptional regulator, partial [Oscillospiraceae bacterium]|nr:helix-turn-helix transcriptional regulator [Oscillospiraceae bacterium]
MSQQLNQTIAALRKEKGLTQEQLGALVGVSAQAVSKWEKGGAPDVELLPAIADTLGVTMDTLFGRSADKREDISQTLNRWLAGIPDKDRFSRLFALLAGSCT